MVSPFDSTVTSKMREFIFDEGDVSLAFVDWMEEVSKLIKKVPHDHTFAKELDSMIHSGDSPLFTACVFGLNPIFDDLAVIREFDWNQKNDLGQNGLYLAAATGHEMIVQRLIQLMSMSTHGAASSVMHCMPLASVGMAGLRICYSLMVQNRK